MRAVDQWRGGRTGRSGVARSPGPAAVQPDPERATAATRRGRSRARPTAGTGRGPRSRWSRPANKPQRPVEDRVALLGFPAAHDRPTRLDRFEAHEPCSLTAAARQRPSSSSPGYSGSSPFRRPRRAPAEQDLSVESQLGLEGGHQRLGAAEPVGLAGEDSGARSAPPGPGSASAIERACSGGTTGSSSPWRNNTAPDLGRPGATASVGVPGGGLGERADEPVGVARLEVVGGHGQPQQVGHPVPGDRGGEHIGPDQRAERGEPAGALAPGWPCGPSTRPRRPATGPPSTQSSTSASPHLPLEGPAVVAAVAGAAG